MSVHDEEPFGIQTKSFKGDLFSALAFVLVLMGAFLIEKGFERELLTNRAVRLMDTSILIEQTRHKKSTQTQGYFLDILSNKLFSADIGDTLYRRFEAGGNQPIDVSLPFSIDNIESTSFADVYIVFGSLLILVFGFSTLMNGYQIITNTKDYFNSKKSLV